LWSGDGKSWSIVPDVAIDDDARKRLDASAQEPISERDAVKDLMGPAA
jgi:malate dehydrogenase